MRIGILGGGPNAMTLGQVARAMGHSVRFLSEGGLPALSFIGECVEGSVDDDETLALFDEGLDIVTFEDQRISEDIIATLSTRAPVLPGLRSLEVSHSRIAQHDLFLRAGCPCAQVLRVSTMTQLEDGVSQIGLPVVLRPEEDLGEDADNEHVCWKEEDVVTAWKAMAGIPVVMERFMPSAQEVVLIAVRSASGNIACYPLVHVWRKDSLIERMDAPAKGIPETIQSRAVEVMENVMHKLEHVGILSISFALEGSALSARSISPCLSPAGRWTREGAGASQAENAIRVITGQEPEQVSLQTPCRTVRLFGKVPQELRMLQLDGLHVDLYGGPDAGGAVGHVTVSETERSDFPERWKRLCKVLKIHE